MKMSNIFSPTWDMVKKSLIELEKAVVGSEHLFVEAFINASGEKPKEINTITDVKNHIRTSMMISGIPWILFDTITYLVTHLPEPSRAPILKASSIETGHRGEIIRPASDGKWQVAWTIFGEYDEQDIVLDWYIPPNHDKAPLVPPTIIEYITSSIFLLHEGLLLPSAALLFIALESTLWDELEYRAISRSSEKITYSPVTWELKRKYDKLLLRIEGSDNLATELDRVLGKFPAEFEIEARKSHDEISKTILSLSVDSQLADCLITTKKESVEVINEKGLSEAVQRARKTEILRTVPIQLDETIIKLRNNLIHLPAQGNLTSPVPIPDLRGGGFRALDDIREEPQFITQVIYIGVELINFIYTNR
jgi:hypothetical protein